MDIVTGKTRPDAGEVLWGEKNVSLLRKSESEIARLGVGRKFQRPTVFEDQSVEDNLMMALKNDRGPFQVLFYNYDAEDQQKVREIAEEIGLISEIGRQAGTVITRSKAMA